MIKSHSAWEDLSKSPTLSGKLSLTNLMDWGGIFPPLNPVSGINPGVNAFINSFLSPTLLINSYVKYKLHNLE